MLVWGILDECCVIAADITEHMAIVFFLLARNFHYIHENRQGKCRVQ